MRWKPVTGLLAFLCAAVCAAQSVPATRPPAPQAILQAPQAHRPASPNHAESTAGSIEGFVYWDSAAIHHAPASSCAGLVVTVSIDTSSGGPLPSYTPTPQATEGNHFTYLGQVRAFLSGGKVITYEVCGYAYDHLPVGPNIEVKLSIAQAGAFSPAVMPQIASVGPIKIVNGQCNMLPRISNPNASDLGAHWGACQNMAYNVSFPLLAAQAGSASPSSGPLLRAQASSAGGGLLTSGSQAGMLAATAPQTPPQATLGSTGALGGSGAAPSSSAGQPSAPLTNTDVIRMVRQRLPESVIVRTIQSHQRQFDLSASGCQALQQANVSAIIVVAMGDGSVRRCAAESASATGATPGSEVMLNPQPLPPAGRTGSSAAGFTGPTRPTLPAGFTGGVKVLTGKKVLNSHAVNSSIIAVFREQQTAGAMPPGQTMSAGGQRSVPLAEPIAAHLAISSYVPSPLLSSLENAQCQQSEQHGAAPYILRIAGKGSGHGVLYSPDPTANPYTVVGCGFGGSGGKADLKLGYNQGQGISKPLTTLSLTVKSWDDHQIVVQIDPNTAHVPDWEGPGKAVYLSVQCAKGRNSAGPGQFHAARKTLLLTNIPKNEVALYQQGSPYFLSPVSNYYGLNGTVAVMRQGLPANAISGQDHYMVQLADGFTVDSAQSDLLVANTTSNVTAQPAVVNGNSITVTYPVLSSGTGSNANFYSIYGLTIWVTGPAGFPALAPQK